MKTYLMVSSLVWACMQALPAAAQAVSTTGTPDTAATPSTEPSRDTARIGTFKQVQGEAWLIRAGTRRPVAQGEQVQQGERVSTGKQGAATLTLRDGTVLTLGPDSSMDLSQFQFDSTTQQGHLGLDLLQGTLRVVTGLLAKMNPERFRISTPTAVVGVRGTDFIVEAQRP